MPVNYKNLAKSYGNVYESRIPCPLENKINSIIVTSSVDYFIYGIDLEKDEYKVYTLDDHRDVVRTQLLRVDDPNTKEYKVGMLVGGNTKYLVTHIIAPDMVALRAILFYTTYPIRKNCTKEQYAEYKEWKKAVGILDKGTTDTGVNLTYESKEHISEMSIALFNEMFGLIKEAFPDIKLQAIPNIKIFVDQLLQAQSNSKIPSTVAFKTVLKQYKDYLKIEDTLRIYLNSKVEKQLKTNSVDRYHVIDMYVRSVLASSEYARAAPQYGEIEKDWETWKQWRLALDSDHGLDLTLESFNIDNKAANTIVLGMLTWLKINEPKLDLNLIPDGATLYKTYIDALAKIGPRVDGWGAPVADPTMWALSNKISRLSNALKSIGKDPGDRNRLINFGEWAEDNPEMYNDAFIRVKHVGDILKKAGDETGADLTFENRGQVEYYNYYDYKKTPPVRYNLTISKAVLGHHKIADWGQPSLKYFDGATPDIDIISWFLKTVLGYTYEEYGDADFAYKLLKKKSKETGIDLQFEQLKRQK